MDLTVIILTLNEEKHIARSIASAHRVASRVVVIDSFSTDATVSVARELGADVYQHRFVSHADQFNWGLDNTKIATEWVMKLDADEYLEDKLVFELHEKLDQLPPSVNGIALRYKLIFMNRWIRFGGRHSLRLLRIWRFGTGRLESRLMDEHVVLTKGEAVNFEGNFCDQNMNDFTFFIHKHNNYSIREAVEYLMQRYQLKKFRSSDASAYELKQQAWFKRFMKVHVYNSIPLFAAPFLYFSFRYFVLLGFLDGFPGLVYHLFQGLWYRFLVAAKVSIWSRDLQEFEPQARLARLETLSGLKLMANPNPTMES